MSSILSCEDTSKSCLCNLEYAGVKEAIEINKYLGFKQQVKIKAIAKASSVFQEIRYRFVNYYIKKSGYTNILDIGCGYSPRTLEFLPLGYKYVGVELPLVTEVVNKAQRQCINEEHLNNLNYYSVKLTDIEGLENAAKSFDGPVCIVIEGVLMYFTGDDLDKTLKAFYNIIKKNGGCIITPDYITNRMMKTSFVTYAGYILGNLMLMASRIVVKKYLEKTNDDMDPLTRFKDNEDTIPEVFFNKRGFKITRVPLYVKDMYLSSFETKDNKAIKAKNCFSKLTGWIVEINNL